MTTVEFRIEGLNPHGKWQVIEGPLPVQGDHMANLRGLTRTLRRAGIKRYAKVRLVKCVTSWEIIGERDVSEPARGEQGQ